MSILVVATKPPWPPVDGGRLVLQLTIQALAEAGHRIVLVAPVARARAHEAFEGLRSWCHPELAEVTEQPRSSVAVRALATLAPYTAVRHRRHAVARRVAEVAARENFDVVHAEQVHAIPQALAARGVPLVVRAHNVESTLWRFAASCRSGPARWLLRAEARRVARWESRTLGLAEAVVALTRLDVAPLESSVGPRVPVACVPAPFPERLPAGRCAVPGEPAVAVLASSGWLPATLAVRNLAQEWWPVVMQRVPEARLHIWGADPGLCSPSVSWHGAPVDSAEAFPESAIAMIPSRHPTGVPMKGLEAWARRLPVVATSDGLEALEATDGREGLGVSNPAELADALVRLREDPALVGRLVAGGTARLETHHAPAAVAEALAEVYTEAGRSRALRAST